jgi:hypothetical protein
LGIQDDPRQSGGDGLRWKEALAAFGVILSLVFVGYELRQNTQATRATVRNDLASASREYLLAQATSPELSAAFGLWLNDGETTPVQDRMVFTATSALLRNLENLFLQVELGTIDDSALTSFGMQAPIFGSRRFLEIWDLGLDQAFDRGFVEAFAEANGLP